MVKERTLNPTIQPNLTFFDEQLSLREAKHIKQAYGREGWGEFKRAYRTEPDQYYTELANGHSLDAINQNFREEVMRIFGIEESEFGAFYKDTMQVANQGVKEFILHMMPQLIDYIGLRDETQLIDHRNPADRLLMMANSSDSVLRFETERQLYLAYIAGLVKKRSEYGELASRAVGVYHTINSSLFSGRQMLDLYSEHDNDTTRLAHISTSEFIPQRGNHIKKSTFNVRVTNDGQLIFTVIREKTPIAAMIKTFSKAVKNGGEITIDEVTDNTGIAFAHLGTVKNGVWRSLDSNDVDAFIDKSLEAVQAGGRVDRIEGDSMQDADRNQSKLPLYDRKQVYFTNGGCPLELLYFRTDQLMNYRFELGEYDAEKGLYTGRAHGIFEFQRDLPIVPYLFPKHLYDQTIIQDALVSRQQRIAQGIREENIFLTRH